MSSVLEPPAKSAQPSLKREYSTCTLADLLHRLGDIPPERVRLDPPPGHATLDDLIEVNEQHLGPICEWVENTLVEKAMGQHESWLAMIIVGELYQYLRNHDIGMILGPDGTMEILPGIGRAPDISFLSWKNLPGGKPLPRANKVPAVVPDLVVEVLSESNRPGEMARKRAEYFKAGVKRVWETDPETRTARVYTGPDSMTHIPVNGSLEGEDILPEFALSLSQVFDYMLRNS